MRKPSDLGFDDSRHILPKLNLKYNPVKNKNNLVVNGQIQIFNQIARRLTEVRAEQRATIYDRCEKAVSLSDGKNISVYWCNLNDEGDLLAEIDKDAEQIKGSMSLSRKEEILLAFSNGEISKLITKPKMTAFGLNWQHCNHTVYFPTFSYEQYYQAIRRFWRFGQKKPVEVNLVYSDGQKRVLDGLIAKASKAEELFSKLNVSLNSKYKLNGNEFNQPIKTPSWIKKKY
jgi:hypothetical protein